MVSIIREATARILASIGLVGNVLNTVEESRITKQYHVKESVDQLGSARPLTKGERYEVEGSRV